MIDRRLVRLRQQLLPNGVQALAWIVTTGTVIIYANSALPSLRRARAVREAMRAANVRGRHYLLVWPAVFLYSFTGKGTRGKTGADRLMSDIRTGAAHVSTRGIIAAIAGAGILTGILAVAVATGSPGSNPARPIPRRAVPAASSKASPGLPGSSSRSTARSSSAASQVHANSRPQGSAANDSVNALRLPQSLTSTPAARTPVTRTTAAPSPVVSSARPVNSPSPQPSMSASPTPAPSRTCSIVDLRLRHVNVCVFH